MESFGIAALEARTAGLAVVARAGTGVEEFVRHDVDGFLVDGDASMAAAVARLCIEPGTLQRILAHNIRHLPRFGWSEVLHRNDIAYSDAARLAVLPGLATGAQRAQPAFSVAGLAFEP